jgi:integrase
VGNTKFFLRRESGNPSYWDRYRDILVKNRIPHKAQVWYVRHVERFIADFSRRPVKEISGEEISDWLRRQSSNPSYQDWQLRQVVDAVQLLLVELAGSRAAMQVDWDYWKEGAKSLQADHPTVASQFVPGSDKAGYPPSDLASGEGEVSADQHEIKFYSAPDRHPLLITLVFLFREVLGKTLEGLDFSPARRPKRPPVVLTKGEVKSLLVHMQGTYGLMAGLMYGTGMRLMEAIRLRVGDVDFERESIQVRAGKGDKDRIVPLPKRYAGELMRSASSSLFMVLPHCDLSGPSLVN